VQQGHAAANLMPLIASNRIGIEHARSNPEQLQIRFHGSSFIADAEGRLIAEAPSDQCAILHAQFDLEQLRARRVGWGVFRDRRPELYRPLGTMTGEL
jgi:N-carbamoylputrescine amidase